MPDKRDGNRPTLRSIVLGKPLRATDPGVFHHVSLIAFLAWVGLGADGLSSSAYGPEEAYKALGSHAPLAVILAGMTAFTVFVISFAYSKLIEEFPGGGGGYLVATKLLGPRVGVVSGCALIVDYILTISVSVVSGVDAIFNLLPLHYHSLKLVTAVGVLVCLVVLNLRGVKESVTFLLPIFLIFCVTHLVLILTAILGRFGQLPAVFHGTAQDFHAGAGTLGFVPMLFILLRAYSMGGGTYTGIEAVSNGVQILREPRVHNAKKTMLYMALSLAFTAGGILFSYLLVHARPTPGKTMNGILAEIVFSPWKLAGAPVGSWLVVATLLSEGMLLFVAAQTGFLDGPRVLANMAVDSWAPHRFAQLSDRLVTKNGVLLIGLASGAVLLYARGGLDLLVTMYAINVFLTFTLTELGMSRHWIRDRKTLPQWKKNLPVHLTGLVLCFSILCVTLYEKFLVGGWVTVAVTSGFILAAFAIHRHYANVRDRLRYLDQVLTSVPLHEHQVENEPMDRKAPTAAILVGGFNGIGIHSLLSIQTLFPHHYENYLFVSIGVIDSAKFKGESEIEALRESTEESLRQYVAFARKLGMKADYRFSLGTEAVDEAEKLALEVRKEFPRTIFFLGKLVFERDRFVHRFLHNETAHAIQRRLQFSGLQSVVLPIRVTEREMHAPSVA
ncbi:MAG TPA: APC family permease [Thermoanaerobaculia bacterium]|nr:APC family permease [Thermoanaerobaculia bacterium]